jgi:hypothetical protein
MNVVPNTHLDEDGDKLIRVPNVEYDRRAGVPVVNRETGEQVVTLKLGALQALDTVLTALTAFGETFADKQLASDVGPHLSCNEVEVVADLLTAIDLDDVAMMWRRGHAASDDEGDLHNEDGSIREVESVLASFTGSASEAHPCTQQGCKHVVPYDDEPYCFEHSPMSGSSVRGYSYKASHR